MNLREAYKRLGLEPGASEKDVDSAFRKKASKVHPDVNKSGTAEQDFKNLNEAYQFLKKRPAGTLFEPGGFDPSSHDPHFRTVDFNTYSTKESAEELIRKFRESMFGNFDVSGVGFSSGFGYGRYSAPQEKQVKASVKIDFTESIIGCTKDVSYVRKILCQSCFGTGHTSEVTDKDCTKCNGTKFRDINGKNLPCTACKAGGKEMTRKLCVVCSGTTVVDKSFRARVHIPAGVQDGNIITLPGKGDVSNSKSGLGGSADAYIKVVVTPDKDMRVVGSDVTSIIELTLLEALAGTTKMVRTVGGEKSLRIPGPRKHGDQIKADGLGIPPYGKHVFVLSVKYPNNVQDLIQFLGGEPQDGYIQGSDT